MCTCSPRTHHQLLAAGVRQLGLNAIRKDRVDHAWQERVVGNQRVKVLQKPGEPDRGILLTDRHDAELRGSQEALRPVPLPWLIEHIARGSPQHRHGAVGSLEKPQVRLHRVLAGERRVVPASTHRFWTGFKATRLSSCRGHS